MTDDSTVTVFKSNRVKAEMPAPSQAPAQQKAARKSILIIAETPGIGERIEEAIGLEGDFEVTQQNRPLSQLLHDDSVDLASRDVFVFEAHPANDLEMKTLRELRQRCPRSTSFLAVTTEPLTLAYAKCLMEIQIDEVLPLTSLRQDQQAATDTIGSAEPARNGIILSVSKTRGGIGATSMVLNMGFALSGKGKKAKNAEPPRIALVDLDFQNGTLGASVDLEDAGAYLELLKDKREVSQQFIRDAMVSYKDHFDVLPAPLDFAPLESMTSAKIEQLLAELRKAYDYVILDLPRALTSWIEPILSRTDEMLIMTDTSVQSIRQARRMISLFTEEHVSLPVKIIVSKEKKPFTQSESIKEAANLLERPLDIWLPRDDAKARKAADLGQPILETARKSSIAKPLSKLIAQVETLRANSNRREE